MKIVSIDVYANNSRTVVYGGNILSFHFFEALDEHFEGQSFSPLNFCTLSNILIAFRTIQLRLF